MPRLRQGDLVIVDFLDHVSTQNGSSDPVPVQAVGWFVGETDAAYVICPWLTEGELTGMNSDTYTILKHKQLKIKKINGQNFRP